MQLGIRLHDVNAAAPETLQTLEARAATAREEGFRCVHLALSKCIRNVSFAQLTLPGRSGISMKRAVLSRPLSSQGSKPSGRICPS